ncbi:MAG TPA: APC family permease [Acidobacteriota bacterium]|nr:APC family permease [Acidobacteriota bacterium]
MGTQPDDEEQGLVRAMGRWDLTAVGVNQVIGSGIFVLPASVAMLVGVPSSPWPFVLAGVANTLIVLCFAEVSTRFRNAGGPYLYAREAFGSFAGFEVAWMLWLTRLASLAALANALARYLAYFLPGASSGAGRLAVVTATIGGLALINFLGVRYGSWTVNFFTVSKLVPLVGFVLAGVFFVDPSRFAGFSTSITPGTGEAVLLLMFAFGGFEVSTLPAGEARTPRRDVPFALLTTIAVVCAFFLSVQLVTVGTLADVASSETPLADAASNFMGPAAGVLMAIGGLISIAGSNAGTMLAGPRVTYAMASRGQLPRFLAHIHARYRTPDASIWLYAAVAWALAASGSFEQMAKVSAVARLVYYVATCAAVPVLRRQGGDTDGFRLPGGALVPALAVLASIAIIFGADRVSLASGAAALVVGGLLYLAYGRTTTAGA